MPKLIKCKHVKQPFYPTLRLNSALNVNMLRHEKTKKGGRSCKSTPKRNKKEKKKKERNKKPWATSQAGPLLGP